MIARCRVCGEELYDAVVLCCDCEAPHHADCFAWSGQCATYACGSRRYSHRGLRGRDVTLIEAPSSPPSAMQRPAERANRPARPPVTILLDLTTPEEWLARALPMLLMAASFVGLLWLSVVTGERRLVALNLLFALLALPISCLWLLLLRYREWLADCYYVVDTRDGSIHYHRRLFGWARTHFVARLAAVRAIRVEICRLIRYGGEDEPDREGAEYRLVLRLDDRRDLVVSDREFRPSPQGAPDGMMRQANQLAQATGVPADRIEVEDRRAGQRRRDAIVGWSMLAVMVASWCWALLDALVGWAR